MGEIYPFPWPLANTCTGGLHPGTLTCIYSKVAKGKSYTAIHIAITGAQSAIAEPVLIAVGKPSMPILVERIGQLVPDLEVGSLFSVSITLDNDLDSVISDIENTVEQHNPGLLVVDEIPVRRMLPFSQRLKEIASKHNIAVLMTEQVPRTRLPRVCPYQDLSFQIDNGNVPMSRIVKSIKVREGRRFIFRINFSINPADFSATNEIL